MFMALNEKQKLLVDKYIANGYNLAKAYEEVYGVKTNPSISYPYQMIKKPEVAAYLQKRRNEIYDSLQIDAKRIAVELADIAFAPKGDEHYTAQMKIQALNTLSKNLGLQTQKVESKDVIEVSIVEDKDES